MKIHPSTPKNHEQFAAIRMSTKEVVGVGMIPLIIGLIALIKPELINTTNNPLWAMRAIGVIFIICGFAAFYFLKDFNWFEANQEGIVWRESEKKREAKWSEISHVIVEHERGSRSNLTYTDLTIVSSNNQVVGILRLRPTNSKSNDKFLEFIESKTKVIDKRGESI